jgi:phage internal scaffolding protein
MAIAKVFYRSPHNYDLDEASDAVAERNDLPSMTIQSQTEDADINVLMKRYGLTGHLPDNVRLPTYGDFHGVYDYQTAMNAVVAADEAFMELPADIRKRFGNSPQLYMEFTTNPENMDEMRKLGIAKEVPVVVESPPMKVEVVNPPVVEK